MTETTETLSDASLSIIHTLQEQQNSYRPNQAVAEQLRTKTIAMIVGPSCVGKSTIINEVVRQDSRFAVAGSFTTREPRADDTAGGKGYTYLPYSDSGIRAVTESIRHGEPVQYAVHDGTKQLYGSYPQDYPADFNLLDTLASNVDGIRQLPFRGAPVIGLVAKVRDWTDWFEQRFPVGHSDREKRKQEAVRSFTWLLDQPSGSVQWVVNAKHHQALAAQKVIEAVTTGAYEDAHSDARGPMLARIGCLAVLRMD